MRQFEGTVFDIQQFSLHDGYGIRTLIFIKGCPLRCKWCSNPESQLDSPEIMYSPEKCIECGACAAICPTSSGLSKTSPIDREKCISCGRCAEECDTEARRLVGKKVKVEELMDIVLRDRVFYEKSGGGVTVGGGEPTCQSGFVAELLGRCKKIGINTAIETCGFASWNKLEEILVNTDLLLFDIKHIETGAHKLGTGVGNEIILENARRASRSVKEMIIRVPLIPGFNSSVESIEMIGKFIRSELMNVKKVDILPYHSIGESKSARLGREYALSGLESLTQEEISKAKRVLESYEIDVTVGG